MRRLLLLIPLVALASFRDLDIGVPAGTPLEWDKTLRQPVPTGGRASVPTTTTEKPPSPGSTVVERVPKPSPDYGVTNLYDFFRVTTHDIMQHVSLSLPKSTGKVTVEDVDVATGGGGPFRLTWNYPPEIPVELAWMAAAACIRTDVHPEVVSEPESVVYCVELGIPAHYGAKAYAGKIGSIVQKSTQALPPQPPDLVKGKTPYEAMLARLAVAELTSGYAYALDPNFARRTLALGEDAYRIVADCTRSKHPLLAENATAVLSNLPNTEVGEDLKRIFESGSDPVCRYRALSGLLRRHDKSAVPALIAALKGKDEAMRCYAMYALGILGEPTAVPLLRQSIRAAGVKDKDVLWSALPAMARIRDKAKENVDLLQALEKQLKDKYRGTDRVALAPDMQTPTAEAPGAKFKILRQMTLLALASMGDADAGKEVISRLEKDRIESFHTTVWYLVADVLVGMGDKGVEQAKKIVDSTAENGVRVHALRALFREGKADAAVLKGKIPTGAAVLRATAIQLLADKDEKAAAEACRTIVAGYAGGKGAVEGSEAFVVATAAQVGGRLKAWTDGTDLAKAAERAFGAGAFARREGENDPDITKCKISIYPPLLETLLIECGRAAAAKALLVKIVQDLKKPQGRPEAALALGAIGGKDAVGALLGVLADPDGWLRFCAYLSLKRLSGQDFFTDWIFAAPGSLKPFIDKYRAWFDKNPPK